MNYRIEYLGFGFTAWQGYTIKNVDKYDDKSKIPTFNTDDAPLTEGLKLLEKGGKIKIVDLDNTKDEVGEIVGKVEEPVAEGEPTDEVEEVVADEVEDEVEDDTEEETTDEVDSTMEVEVKTIELEGSESELTEKDLKNTFTSDELDDVCKKYDISGYSKLNKGEKAELIIKELS